MENFSQYAIIIPILADTKIRSLYIGRVNRDFDLIHLHHKAFEIKPLHWLTLGGFSIKMPTLYSRIQHFKESTGFEFSIFWKCSIGRRALAIWKLDTSAPRLNKTKSIEETGTHMAFDYPESFVPMIDQLLRIVRQEIKDESTARHLKEPSSSPPEIAQPPTSPIPIKIRKRIPTKQIPAWKAR